MAGIYQLNILETEAELKKLLRKEKTGSGKERIQLLYLLKSRKAKTITQASELLGRHRVTLQEWLAKYRQGGLKSLLGKANSPGRTRKIPAWAEQALVKKLEEPKGFESYSAICQWLRTNLGITAKYKTVHSLVYYKLKAAPKIARPQSTEQSEARLQDFKKTFWRTS